jgi:hypothetical protein
MNDDQDLDDEDEEAMNDDEILGRGRIHSIAEWCSESSTSVYSRYARALRIGKCQESKM